jgi:hypothetical protein
VLEAEKFPNSVTSLDTSLANVDADTLSHGDDKMSSKGGLKDL